MHDRGFSSRVDHPFMNDSCTTHLGPTVVLSMLYSLRGHLVFGASFIQTAPMHAFFCCCLRQFSISPCHERKTVYRVTRGYMQAVYAILLLFLRLFVCFDRDVYLSSINSKLIPDSSSIPYLKFLKLKDFYEPNSTEAEATATYEDHEHCGEVLASGNNNDAKVATLELGTGLIFMAWPV